MSSKKAEKPNRKWVVFLVIALVVLYGLLSFHMVSITEENVTRYLLIMVGTSFDPSDEQQVISHDYTVAFQNTTAGYVPIFANVQSNILLGASDLGRFHFTGRQIDSGKILVDQTAQSQTDQYDADADIRFINVTGYVFYMTPIPTTLYP